MKAPFIFCSGDIHHLDVFSDSALYAKVSEQKFIFHLTPMGYAETPETVYAFNVYVSVGFLKGKTQRKKLINKFIMENIAKFQPYFRKLE